MAVLDGFGIKLVVNRSHLVAADGIGPHRRERSWPRTERALRRVVVMGDGFLTIEALRLCRRIGAAVVVVDHDDVVLASATPGLDDARLRRAQASATGTEVARRIVVDLLTAKIDGHARVARSMLANSAAADTIEAAAATLESAADIEEARQIEAVAAACYFAAWPTTGVVRFVAKDDPRVPPGWRHFDGRSSALRLGNSNQRAAQPINALLNYCYRLAEIECRLAAVAVGLDPGLGFLHADYPGRDSLALDLLEPIRPDIEAYILRLVAERTFRKSDFIEGPDGVVRVRAPLTHELAATMPTWARLVAPHAEAVTHALAEVVPGRIVKRTPLTATRRRAAQRTARALGRRASQPPLPFPVCRSCGASVERGDYGYCATCRPEAKDRALAEAQAGKRAARTRRRATGEPDPSHSPEARARLGTAIGTRNAEALAWDAAHGDTVVDPAAFGPITAALASVTVSAIAAATGLSKSYAAQIRRGEYVPHPRHWPALAQLAEVPCPLPDTIGATGPDPTWWRESVVPALATVPTTAITAATGLSSGTASKLRRGLQVPKPGHWPVLATLAGVALPESVMATGGCRLLNEKVRGRPPC